MKAYLIFFCGIIVWLSCVPTAKAQFEYTNVAGAITITGYSGGGGALTIPSTIAGLPVTQIGDNAFANMNVTSVTIPDTVASIGAQAFSACTNLSIVTMGNNVTNIGADAFYACSSLTFIAIPSSVTSIGDSAFFGCTSLAEITVDAENLAYSSVDGVLFDKTQTTLIQFPEALTGGYTIPTGVKSIGDDAFSECDLSSVIIPNSVTTIAAYAFYGCFHLTNMTISQNVTNIEADAFEFCSSLMNFTVDAQNPFYSSVNGVLFNKMQTTLIQFPGALTGSYTIPASVNIIGLGAFRGSSLNSITIPNSVTDISSEAFDVCLSLTNVAIPNSVTNIGTWAFAFCLSLTSVTIPNSVIAIGWNAFYDCPKLTAAYFGGNAPAVSGPGVSGVADLVFSSDDKAVVYYIAGTSGWRATFAGARTEALKPLRVTIAIPKSGKSVSNENFTVSGSVSVRPPVTNILFQLNGGTWNPATLVGSGDSWTASLTLIPGTNSISVYAIDVFGRFSEIDQVKAFYIVSAPLTVLINGDGKVTPNYSNALLEIGRVYTMSAKPSRGFGFVNWTGSIVTNVARLTFLMASNLTFTANFRDISRPVNVVLSPKRNQIVTNSAVVAAGRAKDNMGVSAVWFQVNGAAWLPADLTDGTNWLTPNLTADLVLGTNTLSAFALDAAGNASLTNRVRFRYEVP